MKRLKNQITYLFLFLYIILIFVSPPKYINYPKLFIVSVIKFPLNLFSKISYNLNLLFKSKGMLEENRKLYNKLQQMQGIVVEFEQIKAENTRLREILSFEEKSDFKFLACSIIAKDSMSLSSSIVINAGKKQGVDIGTVAVTTAGIVGRVTDTAFNTSRVLLITDPNCGINAVINRTRCEGMLHGIADGLCKLMYLPLDADVKEGDMVTTSGFSNYFPKGLILGEVIKVNESSDGLSLYAMVRPGFALSRLEEVLCIIK